jgi:GNAT superfamily N-acetyltransferase
MGFEIRTARVGDLTVVRDIYRRSSLSNDGDRRALLANPDALIFDDAPVREQRTRVALSGERIVGFATTNPVGDVDELDDLFVDPDWMRRGIALDLVVDATAIARNHGATRIEVTANGHALAFYAAAGFILDEMTETRFGPGYRMHLDVERQPN